MSESYGLSREMCQEFKVDKGEGSQLEGQQVINTATPTQPVS